jgi:hypothetical protein
MSAEDCFKKTYVKFYYIPPKQPAPPADCKQVKITKQPEVKIFTGQISKLEGVGRGDLIGMDLHCAVVSTAGVGGLILLLQISGYIEWEIEFVRAAREQMLVCRTPGPLDVLKPPPKFEDLNSCPAPGPVVRETHRLYFSMPMLHKLEGPRIALMAITPFKLKLPVYASQIANAFLRLRQLDQVLSLITALKKGFCPEDIRALEEGLKNLEQVLGSGLRWVGSSGGELASLMKGRQFAASSLG